MNKGAAVGDVGEGDQQPRRTSRPQRHHTNKGADRTRLVQDDSEKRAAEPTLAAGPYGPEWSEASTAKTNGLNSVTAEDVVSAAERIVNECAVEDSVLDFRGFAPEFAACATA